MDGRTAHSGAQFLQQRAFNAHKEQIEGLPDEVIAVLKAAISTSAGGTPAQNTAVIETFAASA